MRFRKVYRNRISHKIMISKVNALSSFVNDSGEKLAWSPGARAGHMDLTVETESGPVNPCYGRNKSISMRYVTSIDKPTHTC